MTERAYPRLLLKGAGARRVTEVWQRRSDGHFFAAVRLLAKHPSGFACHPLSKEGSKNGSPRLRLLLKGAGARRATEVWQNGFPLCGEAVTEGD